jgi:peptidoglycan glycosyltransferase
MNAPLRRVGIVMMILFGLLFVNLNWVQGYKADDYRTSDFNGRVQLAEYERQRGVIFLDGGVAVAQSVETQEALKYLRTYPFKETYAHVVGYKPVGGASTGIEKLENDLLAGTSDRLVVDRLRDMFTGSTTPGANVQLTVSKAAQEKAVAELKSNSAGARRGAVIMLDPKTGALLAMASMPTFDPNPLVSHDNKTADTAFNDLNGNSDKPLLNRAVQDRYPPGSTMKVIASAAALQSGVSADTNLQGGALYTAPDTSTSIKNAPSVNCPNTLTLKRALTISCNTAFARLCAERLGADKVKSVAQAFGFESAPTFAGDDDNAYRVVPSQTGTIKDPDGTDDRPALAQSCIGQANVAMTPLQNALVAAAIANDGVQMQPYVVQQLQGPDLVPIETARPRELRRPVSADVARTLQDMMFSVVTDGTGRSARIDGFVVGGKTGTAQAGESAEDHGWFIGFVKKDRNSEPIAAICVFLENAGIGGSNEAADIAGEVMKAYLTEKGLR